MKLLLTIYIIIIYNCVCLFFNLIFLKYKNGEKINFRSNNLKVFIIEKVVQFSNQILLRQFRFGQCQTWKSVNAGFGK